MYSDKVESWTGLTSQGQRTNELPALEKAIELA